MAYSKLSKSDIRGIMALCHEIGRQAWFNGFKAGDEGAERHINPFAKANDENLIILMQKIVEISK
jgi:hypothetical protein